MSYHRDKSMQQPAMPEPMLPTPLRRHHPRVMPLALLGLFLSGQLRAIVPRQGILLEARAVGRRVELERLLEHNGLVGLGGLAGEPDANVLRERNSNAAPERALQREQEPRDDGARAHCRGCTGRRNEEKLRAWYRDVLVWCFQRPRRSHQFAPPTSRLNYFWLRFFHRLWLIAVQPGQRWSSSGHFFTALGRTVLPTPAPHHDPSSPGANACKLTRLRNSQAMIGAG